MENEQLNQQASNKLFRSFDLFVIVPSITFTLLCLAAAIAARDTIPRAVALITGAVFLSATPLLYLIRRSARKIDFVTKHGVAVILGKMHRPKKEDIEAWTEAAMSFWKDLTYKDEKGCTQSGFVYKTKIFKFVEGQIANSAARTTAFFKDGPIGNFYSVYNRLLNGASWGEDIWIAMKPLEGDPLNWDADYTKGVFRHEISHNILASLAPELPFTNEDNHAVFRQAGLGA